MRHPDSADYTIALSWEPSGEECAVVVPWVLGLFGDPRDHPMGADLAVRADVVNEILRRGVDLAVSRAELVPADRYRKTINGYEERISNGTAENRRLIDAAGEARRAAVRAQDETNEVRATVEKIEREANEFREGYMRHMEDALAENRELRAQLEESRVAKITEAGSRVPPRVEPAAP